MLYIIPQVSVIYNTYWCHFMEHNTALSGPYNLCILVSTNWPEVTVSHYLYIDASRAST